MAIPHTSNSIKMWAVIAGVEVEITKATVSYEMNNIPIGTILCPVGINEVEEVAKSHELLKKKWPQPVQLMVEVKQVSGEKRKHLPDGEHVIFDGYVGGAAVTRSLNGFTISFELTHWLSDLNHGSAMSAASHPDNPTRFSYSSTFRLNTNDAGTNPDLKHWTALTVPQSTFNAADMQDDLWEKCILKWFKALAAEDRLHVSGARSCDVGPNDSNGAVQQALGRFINGDPPLKFLTGYPQGIHQIWLEFASATFEATHNANSLAGVSHSTIWDKLINSFGANFHFSIIPFPTYAKVVPFCPLMTDHWKVARASSDYTIQSKDIDFLDFHQKVIRPIKGYMLYGDIGFVSGVNQTGGQIKDSVDDFLGGCYVPNPDGPGMIIIKKLPRYLSNVIQANRKVKAATNVKSTQVHSEEDGGKGKTEDDSIERKQQALTYATALAKFLYHNENIKSRHGQLSGPLRFDICPGSTVKIEGAGSEYNPEGAEITDTYAHVLRITHYIDAEAPRAGTAFHLSHTHTEAEHAEHAVDIHPLYSEPWKSTDCKGTAAPNGNEFDCVPRGGQLDATGGAFAPGSGVGNIA